MGLIRRHKDYQGGGYSLKGRNLSPSIVAARHAAGESVAELMEDFDLTREQVMACVEFRRRRSEASKKGWKTRRNALGV